MYNAGLLRVVIMLLALDSRPVSAPRSSPSSKWKNWNPSVSLCSHLAPLPRVALLFGTEIESFCDRDCKGSRDRPQKLVSCDRSVVWVSLVVCNRCPQTTRTFDFLTMFNFQVVWWHLIQHSGVQFCLICAMTVCTSMTQCICEWLNCLLRDPPALWAFALCRFIDFPGNWTLVGFSQSHMTKHESLWAPVTNCSVGLVCETLATRHGTWLWHLVSHSQSPNNPCSDRLCASSDVSRNWLSLTTAKQANAIAARTCSPTRSCDDVMHDMGLVGSDNCNLGFLALAKGQGPCLHG